MKGHTYVSNPVDEKGYVNWSDTENEIWAKLVARQSDVIIGRANKEFFDGLEILNFPKDKIPQIPDINEKLLKTTGWSVQPVAAVIQPKEFFELLANKKFPAATFIRLPEEIDYIQEPDIFHEIYGHTPLLTNQAYADYLQKFGKLALTVEPKDRRRLFRLFWFTIEFGLLKTEDGLRAFGGGMLSSIGETQACLIDDGTNEKQDFDILNVLRTPYRIDIMQPVYFIISKFEDLFTILDNDIPTIMAQAKELGDFAPKYPAKENTDKNDLGNKDKMSSMGC